MPLHINSKTLSEFLFLVGPKRFGRIGFAINREVRIRPQYYRAWTWRSWEVLGVRVYWWNKGTE